SDILQRFCPLGCYWSKESFWSLVSNFAMVFFDWIFVGVPMYRFKEMGSKKVGKDIRAHNCYWRYVKLRTL
ncbi:hypothetical protein M1707_23030, partial [Salmonella enterica subsp. enterica serovar Saintpaul]|nr:hypothetical protein [Salmonella enterica subsp. enterica serovar Saintpaul]